MLGENFPVKLGIPEERRKDFAKSARGTISKKIGYH